jgi:serine/threonine-protein kinase RsbW
MDQSSEIKQRILLVENDAGARAKLAHILDALGHEIVVLSERSDALAREDVDDFDLIITDLSDEGADETSIADHQRRRLFASGASAGGRTHEHIKAFKIGVNNLRASESSLRKIIAETLAWKASYIDAVEIIDHLHEKIDFELTSDLSLMSSVIDYLLDRVTKLGLIHPERSNLFVALDEAFVNAVKHGNKNDSTKLLRITAELTAKEAIFTIEDEGSGFNISEIPDPCDPANLFRTSGRGVMLMYNIMDKVEYNTQGNRVTMMKRSLETPLIETPRRN